MQQLHKAIILVIIVLMSARCKNEESVQWEEVETLPMSVKTDAIKLKGEIIDESYKFIYAKDFFIYNDSVMIIVNLPSTKAHFIEFYNLNNKEIINQYIPLGRGHKEMINIIPHIRKNKLFVHDFMQNKIVTINIDSVLCDPSYQTPKSTNCPPGHPFVTYLDEENFIMLNPYYFKNEKMGIDNKAPRFIKTQIGSNNIAISSENLYKSYNVTQGNIIPNIEKNKIIFTSSSLSEIEFYDQEMNPLKKITGPDNLDIEYHINENNSIIFYMPIPYTYLDYYIDDDFLYFTYIGGFFTGDYSSLESWIFKFNWNGDFIESYYYPQYISSVYKVKGKDEFMVTVFDDEGVKALKRLTKEGI